MEGVWPRETVKGGGGEVREKGVCERCGRGELVISERSLQPPAAHSATSSTEIPLPQQRDHSDAGRKRPRRSLHAD